MARWSYTRDNFLAGEWSKSAQGKISDPRYKQALNQCLNCVLVEEGACPRRPGFMELGPTLRGYQAMLEPFWISNNLSVVLEITTDLGGVGSANTYLRFWSPAVAQSALTGGATWNLLPDNYIGVTSIDAGNPCLLTLSGTPSPAWTTYDDIYFVRDPASAPSNAPTLNGRQFTLVKQSATTYLMYDAVTLAPIDGSTLNFTPGADWVAHVARITLPYTSPYIVSKALKIVQSQNNAWFLYQGYEPRILQLGAAISTSYLTIPFSFSLIKSGLVSTVSNTYDGPYLDPPTGTSQQGNDTATLSSVSSTTPTLTVATAIFAATDVGRQIRVWSQPPLYDNTVNYAAKSVVTYQGAYYYASTAPGAAGVTPGSTIALGGVSVLPWTPATEQAVWRYGVITAYSSSTLVTLQLNKDFSAVSANGTAVDTYQLGAYTDTGSVYPTGGVMHQGRLILFGAVANRIDASASNAFTYAAPYNIPPSTDGLQTTGTPFFSPTDQYGTVTDACGISYTTNDERLAQILWMTPEHESLIVFTVHGEFLLSASGSSGVITPTDIGIQAASRFSSSTWVKPLRIGSAIVFVQNLGLQLVEYIADVFKAGKYVGRHLNSDAKHLTISPGLGSIGLKSIAYQEEIAPTIWAVTWTGDLRGCIYRRSGTFASVPADYYGWHKHIHGNGRPFIDVVVGAMGIQGSNIAEYAGGYGNIQVPMVVTKSPATVSTSQGTRYIFFVEMMRPLFTEVDPLQIAYHVDGPMPLGIISGTDTANPVSGCSVFGRGTNNGADNVLSNGNLTVAGGNVGANEIAQGCAVAAGLFYFEVKCETGTVTADDDGVGISLPTATAANIATSWTNGCGFGTNNHLYFNGANVGTPGTLTAGDYVAVAVDLVHGRMEIAKNPTAGSDPFGTNPPSETSYNNSWGTDISAVFNNVSADLCALFRSSTASKFTVNNGPTFRFLKPMGLSSGWNGRDYNVPTGFASASQVNVASHGSGNDYYAFTCGGGAGGAKSKLTLAANTSNYYLEYIVSQRGGHEIVGLCDATYVLGAGTGTHFITPTGAFSSVSNVHGELAINTFTKRAWQRDQHSNSWSPSGDPALGTGGTDISGLTWPINFACVTTVNQSCTFEIVTDAKGMKNTPPTGFVAGWPTS